MEIGIATRDITPPPGAPLWGYNGRLGPATGTLDPLYAKAVAFRLDDATAVLVSLDLGRVPVEESLDRIWGTGSSGASGVPDGGKPVESAED